MPPGLHDRIKKRAHQIYQQFMRLGGKDEPLRFWLMAEGEIKQEIEDEKLGMGIEYQEAGNDKH